jgi:hypothetical protein
MAAVIAYWPAVVAALYLLYVLAAGQLEQVGPAISAFLAALGINHTAVKALRCSRVAHDVALHGPRPMGKAPRSYVPEIE